MEASMGAIFNIPSAVWGVSLVDITATGVTRGHGKERNQQRNWETVLQTAGLLTQPIILQNPELHNFNNDNGFSDSALFNKIGIKHQFQLQMLNANINMWIFAIGAEQADVFGTNAERLHTVFDLIPVHSDLDETIQLTPSVFHTSDSGLINIQYFIAPTV
jgi:hypothetical protein